MALIALIPRLANPLALDPFVDEVTWVHRALDLIRLSDPGTWWIPAQQEGRPPMFGWLIALTALVVDNGFLAGRVVAGLAGAGAALAVYWLGKQLYGSDIGLVAGVLWALSPFTVFFARISADDSLLSLWTALAACGSVMLARRPSPGVGVATGAAIGFAVLTKTIGGFAAITAALAVLTLAPRRTLPRAVAMLALAGLASAAIASTLVPAMSSLLEEAAVHADLASVTTAGAANPSTSSLATGNLFSEERLRRNFGTGIDWLEDYTGGLFIGLAAAGAAVGLLRSVRATLFLVLIAVVPSTLFFAVLITPFSRYLLSFAIPLFVLAAVPLVVVADGLGRILRRAVSIGGLAAKVRFAGLITLVLIALQPTLPFTIALALDPARAPIPEYDRYQHFEQWYALNGLGQVADLLHREANGGQVTLLMPPFSFEHRVLIPYQSLRLYFRGDESVRFREVRQLGNPSSLRVLRLSLCASDPRFFLVNGTHTDSAGTPRGVPGFVRRIEAALQRDVPEAREVLRIPRAEGRNWLSLYRFDGAEDPSGRLRRECEQRR